MIADQAQVLVGQVVQDLGADHSTWQAPKGYPGVACSILDAIYSTGNQYSGVERLVARYAALRGHAGPQELLDGPEELIATMQVAGGAESFAEITNNRWRAWARRAAPRKSEVALHAARLLAEAELTSAESVRQTFYDRSARESSPVSAAWHRLPGQRSGLTRHYFLILNGLPGVKADRMIRRYVTRALGLPRVINAVDASRLVEAVGDSLAVPYSTLDHAIWRFEARSETEA